MKDLSIKCLSDGNPDVYIATPEGKSMGKHTGIRKLPNGRFRARYYQGRNAAGKRVYDAKTFDTEGEARKWRGARVAKRRRPGAAGPRLTLGEFLDRWLAQKIDIRENTSEQYRTAIENYIKPGLGNVKLKRLEALQVQEWQAALLRRGNLGRTTVRSARSVLHNALSFAVECKMIDSNPVVRCRGPGSSDTDLYRGSTADYCRVL